MEDLTVAALLREIEAQQARLRESVAGHDLDVLATRPPGGKWSVLENVQHLVLAEREHLGRFVPKGRDWVQFGLEDLPRAEKQLRLPAGGPIEALLDAWRAAHEALVPSLISDDSPERRRAFTRHLRHLKTHVDVVDRLLRSRSSSSRTT